MLSFGQFNILIPLIDKKSLSGPEFESESPVLNVGVVNSTLSYEEKLIKSGWNFFLSDGLPPLGIATSITHVGKCIGIITTA